MGFPRTLLSEILKYLRWTFLRGSQVSLVTFQEHRAADIPRTWRSGTGKAEEQGYTSRLEANII